MVYLAHNGVDHGSAAEAAAHASSDIILSVALVTLVVFVLMGVSLYANKRFNAEPIRTNKKNRR